MKQRITVDDLKSLTPSQQEKLREWWKPQKGDYFVYVEGLLYFEHFVGECDGFNFDCEDNGSDQTKPDETSLPLLNIGQCIELLREKDIYALAPEFWQLAYGIEDNHFDVVDELIDRLFEAVKSIL